MFLVSLLFGLFKMFDIKKSPTARSRAVRPIGYFAVLQDAEQISVPAVQSGSGGLPAGSPTQNGFRRGCAAAVSADKNSRWGVGGLFVRLIVVEHLYLIIESLNDFVKHRMRSLYDESHIFLCRFTFSIG